MKTSKVHDVVFFQTAKVPFIFLLMSLHIYRSCNGKTLLFHMCTGTDLYISAGLSVFKEHLINLWFFSRAITCSFLWEGWRREHPGTPSHIC